ncbi:MAG TPA: hypothetical protein VK783_00305 [Bacteroidia bacterium]|nr:hypothetical protein [Bacteroidia bacterium]
MKIKRILGVVIVIIIGLNSVSAQFNDFLNYPLTVSPHESADSTRGHVWGYMFGSYYTKVHADSFKTQTTQYARLPVGSNAFSMERVYVGYDYFFNKNFSAHIVLAHEETNDANIALATTNYKFTSIFFLKFANMEWKNIFKGSTLSAGLLATPSFDITEDPFWGYRSFDRSIMEMKGITNANDFGVNLGGKIWSKKDDVGIENACIGYNIMVGNSTGSVPDNSGITSAYTVWKKYYGDIYVKLLNDKLVLDFFMDGHTLQWHNTDSALDHAYTITQRIFLGYKTKSFNISAEYFQQTQYNQMYVPSAAIVPGSAIPVGGDTLQNNIQSGFSIMGAAVLMRDKTSGVPMLSIIARYDMFNPCVNFSATTTYQPVSVNSQSSAPYNSIKESYYVIGFDYQPIKQIHFMPNLWYDGITNRTNPDVTYTAREKADYDMVLRLTFYYQFFKN